MASKPPVHYKPHGVKRPTCLDTNQPGALTREQWSTMYLTTDQTNTNLYRVTCPACLRQVMFDIKQRLGE
jgi:hypothetical protein